MPIAFILIGAILIVVAFNNTMGQLASELKADIPGYFVWAIAIAAVLGLGYVPGMKTISRWLLGLVVLVIVLVNYKAILAGFTSFASTGGSATAAGAATTPPNPASVVAAGGTPTAGTVSGTSGAAATAGGGIAGGLAGPGLGSIGGILNTVGANSSIIPNFADPGTYVDALTSGFGGGGGLSGVTGGGLGLGGLSGSLF
jgi:hypothetical protein